MAIDLTELEWALDDVNLPLTGNPNKLEPTPTLKLTGFDRGQKINVEMFNFMLNRIYQAIADLDARTVQAGQLPIGSLYTNMSDPRNPSAILGYGVWESMAGRVVIGAGTHTDSRGESITFTAGDQGGEFNHVLTVSEMPSHKHFPDGTYNRRGGNQAIDWTLPGNNGTNVTESPQGGNQPHNNMMPYEVGYVWKRTG